MVAKRVAEFGPGTPELNIFAQANQFHAAGHRSLCGVRDPKGGVELHLAPGVVCYAFASELYLKAMHQISLGKTPRGHKLNVLFANLPLQVRQVVEGFYREQTGKNSKERRPEYYSRQKSAIQGAPRNVLKSAGRPASASGGFGSP